jgi:hypothetical protein
MGDGRSAHGFLVRRPEGEDHFEDRGVDGRVIVRLIFKKWEGEVWTGLIWLRIGAGDGRL